MYILNAKHLAYHASLLTSFPYGKDGNGFIGIRDDTLANCLISS